MVRSGGRALTFRNDRAKAIKIYCAVLIVLVRTVSKRQPCKIAEIKGFHCRNNKALCFIWFGIRSINELKAFLRHLDECF